MLLRETIYRISYKLRRGKIIIWMDRKNLIRYLTEGKIRLAQCTLDYIAIKSRHDKIINTLST